MQFRLSSGFFIFIGSYLPLAIILAVQDIGNAWWERSICTMHALREHGCDFIPFNHPLLALSFLVITCTSVIFANLSFRKISYPFHVEITQAKVTPNELINYTFPYVVSFMGISFGESEKFFGFAVFLLWMYAITQKSGQILMNPLLLMFGWRLYETTISINGHIREVRGLKKGRLIPGPQRAQVIQDLYIFQD